MKILVTGGCGFIGSHLCKTLESQGNEVISIDITSSNNEIKNNIQHNIIYPLYNFSADVIYNLAGTPSPIEYIKEPLHTIKTNTDGTLNILYCALINSAKILQASTCEVYEVFDPTGNRSCYRDGKRIAESLFTEYYNKYSVDIRIARLCNVYGPGMRLNDGRVIPEFIRRALIGEDLYIMGDGQQKRSFCYIDDIIEVLQLLMDSGITYPVNIRSFEELTILEIAELIIKYTNSTSKICFIEKRIDDSIQQNPNINMAQDLLKWIPKVTFDDGIKRTIENFKKIGA